MLNGKTVLLGVTGGIAAYKAAALAEYNSGETTAHHGGAYGRPFWNANATQFTFVPAFGFPVSPLAHEYLFTATDCEGKKHSFRAAKPTALLTPIWAAIPTGMVTLTVEALSAEEKKNGLTNLSLYRLGEEIEEKNNDVPAPEENNVDAQKERMLIPELAENIAGKDGYPKVDEDAASAVSDKQI